MSSRSGFARSPQLARWQNAPLRELNGPANLQFAREANSKMEPSGPVNVSNRETSRSVHTLRTLNSTRSLVLTGTMLRVLLALTWDCLGQSAPADSQLLRKRAQEFEARLEATSGALKDNRLFHDLSQQQRKQAVEFVTGNVLFTFAHEMGHVFINEIGLRVLGREEDAAEAHAVLVMLRIGNAFSHQVLVDAVKGWFINDQRSRDHGDKSGAYDAHGLDRERAMPDGRVQRARGMTVSAGRGACARRVEGPVWHTGGGPCASGRAAGA